ncbi:hypothetical protein ABK046_27950 [Streptomyces caeruleatus]
MSRFLLPRRPQHPPGRSHRPRRAEGLSGDGLLLRGNTLTAVTELDHPEGQISVLKLSHDYTRAKLVRTVHGHGMHSPSTAAFDGCALLIVNFQFQIADPQLPFSVARVHAR